MCVCNVYVYAVYSVFGACVVIIFVFICLYGGSSFVRI